MENIAGSKDSATSTFDSLAPELLQLIIDHVGTNTLRSNLELLTINKRWYELVQSTLVRQAEVTFHGLDKLPLEFSQVHELMKKEMTHLVFTTRDLINHSDNFQRIQDYHLKSINWISNRMEPLVQLISKCHRLEHLEIHVPPRCEPIVIHDDGHPQQVIGGRDPPQTLFNSNLLSLPSIDKMLSQRVSSNLTCLTLDTFGLKAVSRKIGGQEPNLCRLVAARIPLLHKLNVGAHEICPRMLDISHIPGPLPMQELIVRISSTSAEPDEVSRAWSCPSVFGRHRWRSLYPMGAAVQAVWRKAKGSGTFRVEQVLGHPTVHAVELELGAKIFKRRHIKGRDPVVLPDIQGKYERQLNAVDLEEWLIPKEPPLETLIEQFEWDSDLLTSDEEFDHSEGEDIDDQADLDD